LLPDAPVPDGRTVLTGLDVSSVGAVVGHGRHLGPFIRDTNLLERSLGEVRRRTKVIGRFPGESSCLSLCWAVLDLVITHSNNVTFTDLEQLQLERIVRERAARTTTKEVIAA
jgi:transposase-like protein